jgi:high-affinity Fe2+/Pb2+ permease
MAVVAGATLGSAVLPWSALRHWQNRWRYAALAPLVVLALMLLNVAVARVMDPQSHTLWLFEVFAWAMLNMVYMVSVFTAKRMLEKADAEQEASDSSH